VKIALTGNPFVDTGLAVIASLSKCEDIDDLTLDHMHNVHGDGELLARRNSELKSTSMIFTLNSVATNPAIKDHEKRILYYSKMITAILDSIGMEDIEETCESCGNPRSLDVDKLIRETLVPLGYEDAKRYVGRDWFPLAGSLKSDAQALPSGSRAPNICAKCLFAVHYLPLGVILINGKLAVFQSTSQGFWYDLVDNIAKTVHERVSASNVNTLGSKEGSTAAIARILDVMQDMRDEELDPVTSLFVWRFSNSGTGPDCIIEEIPNPALHFLHEAIRYVSRKEIIDLIFRDKKSPEYSFLNCIRKGSDYSSLYPYKKSDGVSTKLFSLYQIYIRGISNISLNTSYKIATYIKSKVEEKEFESIGKDIDRHIDKQMTVRKFIVQMIYNNFMTYNEYLELFLLPSDEFIKQNYSAWRLIKYYMHNLLESPLNIDHKTNDLVNKRQRQQLEITKILRGRIEYIATIIFNSFIEERGKERFGNEILDNFPRGEFGSHWLRKQFTKLAEKYEGFRYNDWKYLCVNEMGKESTYQLLFVLRLMWTEWMQHGIAPMSTTTVQFHFPDSRPLKMDTDLTLEQENMVKLIMLDYLSERGLPRFQREVLRELRNGEKDLYWFRKQLSLLNKDFKEDGYWEDQFLKDSNGNPLKTLRVFQLHLLLANDFREYAFKQQSVLGNIDSRITV